MKHNPAFAAILKSQSEGRMTRSDAAQYLGVTEQTLAVWACVGRYDLPYIKVGRKVYYRKSDCDTWLNKRTVGVHGDSRDQK